MSILILSEHPSLNEADLGPFTNGFWRYFKAKLSQFGINPRECEWLNCVDKPSGSMFAYLVKGKAAGLKGYPEIANKHYLAPFLAPRIGRLAQLITSIKPNLVLAVGDIPLAILTRQSKMSYARGRITTAGPEFGGVKVLPILHPSKVMSDMAQEPIYYADLLKARREAAFPEVRRPQRWLHLRPSIEDLEDFWQEHIVHSPALSVDIETKGTMITCVGFAPQPDRCLVVPFYDEEKKDGNYWATKKEEVLAWQFVRRCLNTPTIGVFGQNFSYDAQYLLRQMGIPTTSWRDDTMIMHHAMQPEMPKGLGFLASVYTDELAWKFMHKRKSSDRSGKKEDE